MADAPSPPTRSTHDKWISLTIWISLLVALVYTSVNTINLAYGGSVSTIVRSLSPGLSPMSPTSANLVAIGILITAAALVYQLFRTWQKFADLTHDLIVAYAKSAEGDIFLEWLNFRWMEAQRTQENHPSDEKMQVAPDESDGSAVSEVVIALAYVWAILLIAPSLIATAITFLP